MMETHINHHHIVGPEKSHVDPKIFIIHLHALSPSFRHAFAYFNSSIPTANIVQVFSIFMFVFIFIFIEFVLKSFHQMPQVLHFNQI